MCRRVSVYTVKWFRFPSTQTWQLLLAPIVAHLSLTASKNGHVHCGSVATPAPLHRAIPPLSEVILHCFILVYLGSLL